MEGECMGLLVSLASGAVGGQLLGMGEAGEILGTIAGSGAGSALLLFAVSHFKK